MPQSNADNDIVNITAEPVINNIVIDSYEQIEEINIDINEHIDHIVIEITTPLDGKEGPAGPMGPRGEKGDPGPPGDISRPESMTIIRNTSGQITEIQYRDKSPIIITRNNAGDIMSLSDNMYDKIITRNDEGISGIEVIQKSSNE